MPAIVLKKKYIQYEFKIKHLPKEVVRFHLSIQNIYGTEYLGMM